MYNYLAGFKLQMFNKLHVEKQCVCNRYIKVVRVQSLLFIVLCRSL